MLAAAAWMGKKRFTNKHDNVHHVLERVFHECWKKVLSFMKDSSRMRIFFALTIETKINLT